MPIVSMPLVINTWGSIAVHDRTPVVLEAPPPYRPQPWWVPPRPVALQETRLKGRQRGQVLDNQRIASQPATLHTPGMPLHMDISPLHRLVVIVARGHITAEEIADNTRRLVEAKVPGYAKIIDVSQAKSDLTRNQVQKVADLLRGAPGDASRGPVAFVLSIPTGSASPTCSPTLPRANGPSSCSAACTRPGRGSIGPGKLLIEGNGNEARNASDDRPWIQR